MHYMDMYQSLTACQVLNHFTVCLFFKRFCDMLRTCYEHVTDMLLTCCDRSWSSSVKEVNVYIYIYIYIYTGSLAKNHNSDLSDFINKRKLLLSAIIQNNLTD